MQAAAGRYGYWGRILWVDLTERSFRLEERDDLFWRGAIGGGLAAVRLLLEETPRGVDPLGPENLLLFCSSVVAGQPGPGLARFTTAARSPLTGGIGETRTEGPWGVALKASGADIIAVRGAADRPLALVVESGGVEFVDVDDLWGLSVGAATDALERRLGPGCHVATIGPAGENRVRFASIVTDRTYQASRMGMGAVMGSKRLKAVALRPGAPPPVSDSAALARYGELFAERAPQNDLTRWQQDPPGFSCWIYLHGLDAALDVHNYRDCTFGGLEAYREERFLARTITEAGCPHCAGGCIKAIHPLGGDDLDPRASGMHQEITGALGPNVGIADLDAVLRLNNLCNEQGMDPTSLGFTISMAMELGERGLLAGNMAPRFGDAPGVIELAGRIARREGLGDLLAEGTRRVGERLGGDASRYAMHVKGLEMVPFEPRSQTNLALGYALAPIGPRYDICEHDWDFDTTVGWEHTLEFSRTLGILERVPMDSLALSKVRNFKALLTLWSAADALDMCIFAVAPTRVLSLEAMAGILRAVTGWETSSHEVMRIGERRLHLMRLYNLREGLSAEDDTLPDRFFDEPIASGPRKGDVLDRRLFGLARSTFYQMMGWDEGGAPTPGALWDHGLGWAMGRALK